MRTSATRFSVLLSIALSSVLWSSRSVADGYKFEAVYTADVLSNVSGGLKTGTRYLDNLDLMLEVDLAKAAGSAGTLFIYGLYNNGTTFADELVGDLMVNSNIDAAEAWRIFELWYEVGEGPCSARAGLYDLNSEFDVNETGSLFLNSSHGIGAAFSQTGKNGPSIFPVSSLALRLACDAERFTTRVALLDGVPGDPDDPSSNEIDLSGDDGVLFVGELELALAESSRLWVGYWRYSADFARPFGSGFSNGNDGWYIGGERSFPIGTSSAFFFLRYGQAEEELNPIRDYIGAGVVIDGLIAARRDDRLGISVATARAGNPYRDHIERAEGGAASRETEWELTYRARVNEHLVVQPDFQLVKNPHASRRLDDAWIIGLRFEVSY